MEMNGNADMLILLRLVFAHILADFALQPDAICRGKQLGGLRGMSYLSAHSLIHAMTAYLLVGDWANLYVPVVIFASHLFIDWLKSVKGRANATAFVADQAAHLIVIVALWAFLFADCGRLTATIIDLRSLRVWIIGIAYLLVLQPSSLLLGLFISKWTPEDSRDMALPNAGKWIGYAERVLILTFIFTSHFDSIGFLLAAKSIFRFGELSKAREIRTTEYVLIGTLSSFALAIGIGVAANSLLLRLGA